MRADLSVRTTRHIGAQTHRPLALRDLTLVLPPTPLAVRSALKCSLGALSGLSLCAEDVDAFQSALAEILNNIVEHAYGDGPDGRIELRLHHDVDNLVATILDDGAEMPGGNLPGGLDTWDITMPQTLPEGGFGWFLIRQQVEDLSYSRTAGINRVSFRRRLTARG